MDISERLDMYRRAVALFGEEHQIIQTVEELSELSVVLCKIANQREFELDDLLDELADVRIMIEQMEMMFNCPVEVQERMTEKIMRLKNTIYETHKQISMEAIKNEIAG